MEKVEIIPIDAFTDERGKIATIYQNNSERVYCEDKISISHYNVLRGFHGDFVTGKLITCLAGTFELAWVDLRKDSPSYLRKERITLRETDLSVYIPPGFVNAHLCLSHSCIFHYKLTSPYMGPDSQISIRWDSCGVTWSSTSPRLSNRDKTSPTLGEYLERL